MSSEQLGAAQNVLKGNLGGAWDITNGYQDAYTDLGIARRFGGSAAAYSLRDIGAMNGRVVKVRRDLAGEEADAEEDFSASQVQSGALENWVNGKLENTLPADVATAAAAYSLRKVKASYASNAVRIRRGSDNVEVDVAFDSDDKVSASSAITNVAEQGGESGSTNATDLNGFLNESVSGFIATSYSGIDASYKNFTSDPTISNTAFSGANGGTQSRLTYQNPFGYSVSASDFDGCKVKVTGTVNTLSGGNITIKPNTQSNGGGSWTPAEGNKVISDGTTGSFEYIFTGDGTNLFKSVAFLIDASTTVDVSNLTFEFIEHGATVHTWYDQAGSNNAVQTTAANQPKIAENGALLADGVDFDGTNDYLDFSEDICDNINSFSGFVQAKSDGATSSQIIFSTGFSGSNSIIGLGRGSTTSRISYVNNSYDIASASALENGCLLSIIAGSSTAKGFNNAVEGTSQSSASINPVESGGLGAHNGTGSFFDGKIKEAIFYKSDQSNNRFKIESNINNYYSLYNDANEVTGAFTASGENSFTANGTDGFTLGSATAVAFAGIELNEKVPDNDIIYISFNADLSVSGTATPTVELRKTSISGTLSSDSPSSGQPAVIQGFNSFALVSDDADAKFVTFTEGDDNVTFTISDFKISRIERNGFVPTWYDQSTSGNNATQSAAGDQPRIVLNGGLVKNSKGKPALDFVATADHLDVPIALDNINTASAFLVWERDVNSGNGAVAGQLGSSSSTSRFYTPLFTSSTMYFGYGNSSTKISMGSYDANRTYLTSFVTGDTNAEAFLNNVSKGTTALQSVAIDAANGSIGRHTSSSTAFALDGQVSEVIYYKAKLQDDVADLNADINNHYNIY